MVRGALRSAAAVMRRAMVKGACRKRTSRPMSWSIPATKACSMILGFFFDARIWAITATDTECFQKDSMLTHSTGISLKF